MPICKHCVSIETGERDAKGHLNLNLVKAAELRLDGKTPAKVTFFECNDCGTRWYHQSDPNDPAVGWVPLS